METQLLLDVLAIVLIDLLLAGDNAVVIALAVKHLSPQKRKLVISLGAGLAVLLRVVLTFFAAQLLQIQFLKLVGGALVVGIAIKLLTDAAGEEEANHGHASTLWQALWYILVADVTMSTDNVLAVAGASKGNLALLVFGLGLSIPFVVFTSNLLSRIMDRFPIIAWIGAAILGRVGGEMMITDPYIHSTFHPSPSAEIAVQILFAAGVLAAGYLLTRRAESSAQVETAQGD